MPSSPTLLIVVLESQFCQLLFLPVEAWNSGHLYA
jgi:hypothetical protein